MVKVILDALRDTLNMVPILFGVYLILEYVEARWQQRIVDAVEGAGHVGPLVAAAGGAIPQCGFSVMASALYTQRLLTMGTIVAVYLATSDEALPILLSRPDKAYIVLPLVGVKVLLAVAGGYLVDAFMRSENRRRTQECQNRRKAEQDAVRIGEQSCSCDGTRASCTCEETGRVDWKEIFWSATKRTAQIILFVLVTSLVIGLLINWVGQENLSRLLLGHTIFQPVLTAFLGLIPNCAASVAITELYIAGTISFGSTVAGLGAAGGLGLVVLFRENHDMKNTLKVVAWLLGISITAGILIQSLSGK
ncbi:MAG TPA: putative manganese transporter [Candidatus Deferrimicrobium sp.]|nr:putative manganese transporter [Candidatus Deferrimicrobium sp.]